MANPLTALYRVIQKNLPGAKPPLASDVNQFVDLFNGKLDAGQLQLAGPISTPSITGVTATSTGGTGLGIGVYLYKFTFVTGNIQADNAVTVSGETGGSSTLSVTTTSGNQNVTLSGLPGVASWPLTAIGINIYRTTVGGADGTQKLVGSIYTNYARNSSQTSFVDNVADNVLGTVVPTSNTTGTNLQLPVQTTLPPIETAGTVILVNGAQYISNGTQWVPQTIGSILYQYNNAWGGF